MSTVGTGVDWYVARLTWVPADLGRQIWIERQPATASGGDGRCGGARRRQRRTSPVKLENELSASVLHAEKSYAEVKQ
jgi:hypothetical protein